MLRRHWPLAAHVALALALRLPWLGALPNPSGDEGNWTWIAYDLYAGRPAALPPDARFVSLAFAHLIALAFHVAGPSFAAARAVLVAATVLGMLAAAALCRRLGLGRAGLAIAAVLAVHPWSVLWSRTVTVPYALSLALAVVGPLALLRAVRARSAPGLVVAAQLLAAGVHFSPLALLPVTAAALWLLAPARRGVLRGPAPWVALALAALHGVPVLRGAVTVAGRGTTRPSHFVDHFLERVHVYLRTVLGGLGGEATLRHFTGTQLARPLELALLAAVLLVLALAWPRGAADDSPARELERFAARYFLVALVGLALVLAPARPWNLPAIDAERYLFATLAPFALLLGALAERARGRWVVATVALYLLLGPTRRAARYFLAGGSIDRGFYTLAGGGGYRGWKVPREREALPVLLRREVDALAGAAPATIVVADYAFHPLHFANAAGGHGTVDIAKFPLPVRRGERHAFVTWSPGLFAPGYTPPQWPRFDAMLRATMRSADFVGLRRVRVFVQPDGSPLCELWTATRR